MNRSTPATRRHRIAVSAVFAANGSLFGSLFARLPEVQDRLDLSAGELGLALLGGPVGLVGSVALAGAVVVRQGSKRVTAVGGGAYAALLVLPALVTGLPALMGAMLALGAASGLLDVAMNTQGVTVERRYPRRIFASLHAAFSLGALAGSATAGLIAAAGMPLAWHLLAVGAAVAVVLAAAVPQFLPDAERAEGEDRGPVLARPSRALAALGAVAFATLLAEGALNDWSAVFLVQVHDTGAGTAAAGLAAFSIAMAAGRLSGDRLAARLGSRALARGGLAVAATGFGVAAAAPGAGLAIAAFVALGLGLASVYPLCMRAAAARADVPAAAAIAAVTTTGYVGFMAGPPLVGLLAHASSLRLSLGVVGALCAGAALLARAVQDEPQPAPARRRAYAVTAAARPEKTSA